MTARPDLNAISEGRIAAADRVSKRGRPSRDDLFLEGSIITHLDGYPARTDEEAALAAELGAAEVLAARRATARAIMVGGHQCTGRGCRRRRHAADRERLEQALQMLGFLPYETADNRYHWGQASGGAL